MQKLNCLNKLRYEGERPRCSRTLLGWKMTRCEQVGLIPLEPRKTQRFIRDIQTFLVSSVSCFEKLLLPLERPDVFQSHVSRGPIRSHVFAGHRVLTVSSPLPEQALAKWRQL